MTERRHGRSVYVAMTAGLALTLLSTVVPYVDQAGGHVLADHVRAGYPAYTQARVDTAVTAYVAILSVIGGLGSIAWIATIWAVKAEKSCAPVLATAMLTLGATIGLTGLLTKDTSGDTGLPPELGWMGMAPSLAGLLAVILLYKKPRAKHLTAFGRVR